jgi:salicylate hydroxylase
MRVLQSLGLEQPIIEASFEPNRHVLRSWKSGRLLFATAMKGEFFRRFGAGYYQIHRADLHKILAQAVPDHCIHLNSKCVGMQSAGDGAVLTFADGRTANADVVVGADGIHSVVRQSLFGADSPRFTGNTCWRGIVPVEVLPKNLIEPDSTVWLGPYGHVVHYYVRGGQLVNFVACYEASDWRAESWVTEAKRDDLMRAYTGWNPKLLELFQRSDKVYRWALYDRDPLPQWSKGCATLIGDSAHPMLPYLAQGACMAIEDGYVLADVLAEQLGDAEGALQTYEALRRPRTSQVQLNARARAKINHLSSPLARMKRDLGYTVKRVFKPKGTSYGIEWIYSYDATSAAARSVSA